MIFQDVPESSRKYQVFPGSRILLVGVKRFQDDPQGP